MKIGIAVSSSSKAPQYVINRAYVDYVREAGYQPVLIVPGTDIRMFVGLVDGIIMPGGIDLDPIYYGQDNHASFIVNPDKDAFEREILHTARELGKPIFGICRGFQLIIREYMLENEEVHSHMVFEEDIEYHAQTADQKLTRNIASHFVDCRPDILYGTEVPFGDVPEVSPIAVNSMHHQCLLVRIEPRDNVFSISNFEMAAWTYRGINPGINGKRHVKVCEAFRINGWGAAPILAVQWHPEELRDIDLIQNFFGQTNAGLDQAGAV